VKLFTYLLKSLLFAGNSGSMLYFRVLPLLLELINVTLSIVVGFSRASESMRCIKSRVSWEEAAKSFS
jgi:nucleoside permease NupC